jgi:hypothetical protein
MKWGKLPCPILLVGGRTVDCPYCPFPSCKGIANLRGGKRFVVSAVVRDALETVAFNHVVNLHVLYLLAFCDYIVPQSRVFVKLRLCYSMFPS